MAMNLVEERGDANVWDQPTHGSTWDPERWLVGLAAGTCLVSGLRRRSTAGLLLALGGTGLAWWAVGDSGERRARRGRLQASWPGAGSTDTAADDPVGESSAESFPASDAPSWTPTTAGVRGEREAQDGNRA